MKIGCVTIAWGRPAELGRMIRCFELQDYLDRELVVLDDGGMLPDQPHGDRWQVVSFKRRFRTIGEKRAASVGLLSPDTDVICVWDADDIYLPWALSSVAAAIGPAPWAQARVILEWNIRPIPNPELTQFLGSIWHKQETFSRSNPFRPAYHSTLAMTREAYCAVGGYPPSAKEDWTLCEALLQRFGPSADSTADDVSGGRPWMAYSRGKDHLSERIRHYFDAGAGEACFAKAWAERAGDVIEPVTEAELKAMVKWDRPYDRLEIPPEVHCRPW